MEHWLVRQLCAHVVHDLRDYMSPGWLPHLSDPAWGGQAYKLGMVFAGLRPPEAYGVPLPSGHMPMTARQLSAADVLLNLGLQEATRKASERPPPGWGDREVTHFTESLRQLEQNTRGALRQYLKYLPEDDAAPFLPLLGCEDAEAHDEPEQPTETETAQERQTRRLADFRAAGGREPTNDSGRWKGVGKVAERMGISRQALTDDLKAAVEREREQRRGSGALDPARLGWMK